MKDYLKLFFDRHKPPNCNCTPDEEYEGEDTDIGGWLSHVVEESFLDSFYKSENPCPVHGTDSYYHQRPHEIEPDPKLNPCPHCGGKAAMDRRNDGHTSMDAQPSYHIVSCGSCGAKGPRIAEYYDADPGHTKAAAAKAWNRRPRRKAARKN